MEREKVILCILFSLTDLYSQIFTKIEIHFKIACKKTKQKEIWNKQKTNNKNKKEVVIILDAKTYIIRVTKKLNIY